MPVEVVMPKLGLNMSEGLLVEWLKKEGDRVERGDPLFIVETDKVTTESDAQASGILTKILVSQGETVPVKAVVALIQADGEVAIEAPGEIKVVQMVPEPTPAARPAPLESQSFPSGEQVLSSPVARRMAKENGIDLSTLKGSGPGGRIIQEDVAQAIARQAAATARPILASPVAKRLAREHGIDLSALTGTGPEGRIIHEDVERALQEKTAVANTIPVDGVRAVIARRMLQSVQTTAQVTLHTETDATNMVAFRNQLKREAAVTGRPAPGYNAILISLVAKTLQEHPRLNARQVDQVIQLQDQVNLGLAVDTESGLLVVVVKDSGQKSIAEIQDNLDRMVERALARQSLPEDLDGSTFTLTNLGMFGIDGFTPIINPPEMAILGVGRIVEKLVVREGKVMQRHMLTLSLTFDHRLVDGAPAARFLQSLCALIEDLK